MVWETRLQSQVESYQMVLDASLLNSQQYKVRFKSICRNVGKGIAPSPTAQCFNYRERNLSVGLEYVCLFGFYGMSTFVGCLIPNHFYFNKQFYFKQFSFM